jgi:hypothetical protein
MIVSLLAACAVMCGPPSCALRVKPLEYHGGRLVSYGVLGAFAGAAGQVILGVLKSDTARLLPWVLAGVMLIIGLGLDRRLPQPRLLQAGCSGCGSSERSVSSRRCCRADRSGSCSARPRSPGAGPAAACS